ncbi:MAG: nuclear transport factor 2 family protein [Acidobacteriota bacterium]|nr:nuclear transport factor 2 family protein [Acidobacteriota bacterium]
MSPRAAVIFLAALVLLWVALPRLQPASDDAGTVREMESRLAQAAAKGNAKALDGIVANDFFAVDADGNPETRSTVLDQLRTNPWNVQAFQQQDLEIHLYGQTAVSTGVDRVQARDASGRDRSGVYRFLHVFQKRNGRWWLIAGQGARLPGP